MTAGLVVTLSPLSVDATMVRRELSAAALVIEAGYWGRASEEGKAGVISSNRLFGEQATWIFAQVRSLGSA